MNTTATEVLHNISLSRANFTKFQNDIRNKDATVCLGNTRSGKSTVVNYLKGNELEAFTGCKRTHIKKSRLDQNGPTIGHGSTSCTRVPSVWNLVGQESIVVDMPGFEDCRGVGQNVVNAIFFNQLKYARSLRFILVCDITDIESDSVRNFTQAVSKIEGIIEDLHELKDSICVVFTKACKDYRERDVAELLNKKVVNVEELHTRRELVRNWCANVDLIGVFKMPEREGLIEENVTFQPTSVNKTQPLIRSVPNIKFRICEASHAALLEVHHDLCAQVNFTREIGNMIRTFENYFTIDKYVYASTETELETTRRQMLFCIPRLGTELAMNLNVSFLKASVRRLTGTISEELELTLDFFTVMKDCDLLDDHIEVILMQKYRSALRELFAKVQALIVKIDAEVESRRRETVQYVISEAAADCNRFYVLGASLIPIAKRVLETVDIAMPECLAFEVVEFSTFGCGIAGACIASAAVGGYAMHYYENVYKRKKLREQQGR